MTANANPATYFQAPMPGDDASIRGATMNAIRPATRNQDDDTRTSLPAIVPILNVPDGRGAGGRVGHAARLSDGPDVGGLT